jgi:hypothetical protein
MTRQLDEIPLVDQKYDGEVRPTTALRGMKLTATRRSVIRGIGLSALTVGTLSLTWGAWRGMAETGPGGLPGWDRNDCKDAYPDGYEEQPDTDGEFKNSPAACFGGELISSEFCANGWYRADETREGDTTRKYGPVSTDCGESKNAWRWTTPDGKVYRCSDGNMTVTANGQTNTVFSICRALV